MTKVVTEFTNNAKETEDKRAIEFPIMGKMSRYDSYNLILESDDKDYYIVIDEKGDISFHDDGDIDISEIILAPVGATFTFTQSS